MKLFYSILAAMVLASCNTEPLEVSRVDHVVVNTFKLRPVSIHDEINPRYKAVLENGDTVPVWKNARIGDTITYLYHNVHK